MKKIAIVADLPVWAARPEPVPPTSAWHYCVWLAALRKLLDNQNDYHVHWIIPDKSIKERTIIETRVQTFHIIPKARLTLGLYSGYAYDVYHIIKELKRISPDLVHSWGTENSHSLAACHYEGKKLLSIQGLLTAYAQRARLARFERYQAFYEPYTIRRFNHVTTESPWAERRVREISDSPIFHHLEYAVEDRFFNQERVLSNTPICLYAGTNAPVKNISTLVRAFRAPKLSHIQLYLAGIRPEQLSDYPENVTPLGPVSRDGIVQLLSKAWCLVHPSLADTGPTIAKEARVMGLPVMLTTACGSMQHIEHGKSGFIVEPDDVAGMQNSILQMTADAQTSLNMGAHGQQECRTKLSSDTMLTRLLEIYSNILN